MVDASATVTAGTQLNQTVAATTDTPVLSGTNNVHTGSTINGIYLKVEVASNEAQDVGAIPNVYMIVTKNPGGNITIPTANAVGANDNKRYVIHQEMVMIDNNLGGNPRVLFNGVIAIPKGYRRFGPDDDLVVSVLSPAINFAFCLQCHYKEFK